MFKLAVYLKDYKKECLLGPFFKFLEVISELLLPTVLAFMINKGIPSHDTAFILKIGCLMTIMSIAGYGCALVCQFFAAKASQGFGTALRNVVFHKILSFSFTQLDRFGASTLTTRLTNDINQLQVLVAMMIRLMIRAPFIFIGAIAMSFFLDSKLALLLIAATPFLSLIIFGLTKTVSPLYRNYQRLLDKLTDVLRENLSGVRVIRSFGKSRDEKKRFEEANGNLMQTGLGIGNLSALFNPLTSLVVNFVIVAVLWVGGIHIQAGRLSQGQVIAFINYVTQILYALFVISNLIILITKSMAAAARINEVLETDVPARLGVVNPVESEASSREPEIVFQDVSFSYYNSREEAVSNISFSIAKGETVGIIGGTGCGKTTLVNLLAGFYSPGSGHILLNGRDIGSLPEEVLREKVAVVQQKAVLFTGTIAENICFGHEDADMQAVTAAAKAAQAEEFIQGLEAGYDTMVERGGANLSGGQRQRLAIARALLMKPEILLLDDASSALDFLTDARLRAAIRKDFADTTVLIVSQRVGVIRNADRILVLDDGRTAGYGTHGELFENCGVYRQICLSQLTGEEAAS